MLLSVCRVPASYGKEFLKKNKWKQKNKGENVRHVPDGGTRQRDDV